MAVMDRDAYYIQLGKDVTAGDASSAARRLHEHETPGCDWDDCPLREDYIRKAQAVVDAVKGFAV